MPVITTKDPINLLAAFGLALGAVFGMAGTFAAQPNLQALLWAIDSAGLVMAAALLALKYFRAARRSHRGRFSHLRDRGGCAAVGHRSRFRRKRAGVCGQHGPLGDCPPANQHPAALRGARSPRGRGQRDPLCDHRRENLLGRNAAAYRSTTAIFAYPVLVLTFIGWIWSLPGERT
jgi:hypothetical protein